VTEPTRIAYSPREQFWGLHSRSQRWSVCVAHRRCGKTVACINELIKAALTCPRSAGRFAYVAPLYSQAKDAAWSYLREFSSTIPGVSYNESELRADLPNGSRVRLYGASNYDALRGTYFDGIVLDEYGDMDPRAWVEVIRPALADRLGWAVFIGTPKGKNHFSETWNRAQGDAEWFTLMLRASETGLLPQSELDSARKEMSEDQYNAEFECSFSASVVGAYYSHEFATLEKENRLSGAVPYEPRVPVHTSWDLGMSDSTSIWFCQVVGRETRLIDYVEDTGRGLDHYAKILREKPYVYGRHFLPHDASVRELGTGLSRLETLRSLGIRAKVLPRQTLADGIQAVRNLLPQCWFDRSKCARGIEALQNYRREWDERDQCYKDNPKHNWASHASDAFRYLAEGKPSNDDEWSKPIKYSHAGIV
jgi:phage terminase large subunit